MTPGFEQMLRSANVEHVTWVALASYCLGCFSTGYYLVRYRSGEDLRELGSGSVGATNAGRLLGWPGFALTVSGDFCKGFLAVWATAHFNPHPVLLAISMLAVVTGHIYPAQLRFQGGKGAATSLGALLVYDARLACGYALLFASAMLLFRNKIWAGLVSFISLPVVCFWLPTNGASLAEPSKAVWLSILVALIVAAHRKNIVEESHRFVERRKLAAKSQSTNL